MFSFVALAVVSAKQGFADPEKQNINTTVNGTACINFEEKVPQEGIRRHIPEDQEGVYASNPPVTGEHYARWGRWQIYTQTLRRGYWVHNLEHGGVIFLYHPEADPSLIEALVRVYNAIPNDPACEHPRALLTPDPLLDASWAVTSSGREPDPMGGDFGFGYYIKGDCIESEQALVDFAVEHRNQAFEDVCDHGDAI
jgi:hypothetical protein